VNASRSDLPLHRIVLIDAGTRQSYFSTGRRMACEGALVKGFKTPFNNHHTGSEDHILHNVAVSRERSDKWPDELLADGFASFHASAGDLKHYIFRIVRHDEVHVSPLPHEEVLIDK